MRAAGPPEEAEPELEWLDGFEPHRGDHDRGVINVRAAAQVSECLAPRLRTPEAEEAWTAATSNEYLHRIRRHGLELPLTDGIWPAAHDAGGNSIKPEYVDWARGAIHELCEVGAISAWEGHVEAHHAKGAGPRLVMPLIVEPKPGRPGKFRLIHDCRHLNKLLDKSPFKMENLADFVKQLSFRDKLFSIDIESAYHHVEVTPRHRTLLGFRFEGVTYVYNVLPFGLTTSASVFCAFTAVTAKAVRDSGLVSALIVYVDDFGGSVGKERDTRRMDAVLRIFRSFGWVLAPSKLNVDLVCRIKLLGFMLDTETMRIGIPEGRRLKLVRTAEEVWRHRRRVSVRLVCQLVGQIISIQLALGLVCRLRSRYLLHSVREAARAGDYRGVTGLCSRAMDEVKLFATQVDALEEQPMHKHKRKANYVMHCDASDHALAAIITEAPTEEDTRQPFYRRLWPHEATWSSVLRELTGYRDAYMTLRRRRNMSGMVVEVVGDSLCCQ